MKTAVVYKLTITVCLVMVLLSLTACEGTQSFSFADITMIELQSGTTGDFIEIKEQEQIQNIIQPFNENEFQRGESSKNSTGWSYRLRFYQVDKMTTEIVVMGSGRINFNDRFYDTSVDVIDIEYYEELLNTIAS